MRSMKGKPWFRGVITLTLVGAVAGGLMLAPVNAAHSDAHVRNLAKQVVKQNGGIFAMFSDASRSVPTGIDTVATLSVPSGRYAIFAKTTVTDPADIDTQCILVAGNHQDEGWATVEQNSDELEARATLNLQVGHRFRGSGTIRLRCDDDGDADDIEDIKIMAIRQPTLRNRSQAPLRPVSSPEDA
jgi:hypothetical protein